MASLTATLERIARLGGESVGTPMQPRVCCMPGGRCVPLAATLRPLDAWPRAQCEAVLA
jgi:hypothetical protein